jgi:hypothetical protein
MIESEYPKPTLSEKMMLCGVITIEWKAIDREPTLLKQVRKPSATQEMGIGNLRGRAQLRSMIGPTELFRNDSPLTTGVYQEVSFNFLCVILGLIH